MADARDVLAAIEAAHRKASRKPVRDANNALRAVWICRSFPTNGVGTQPFGFAQGKTARKLRPPKGHRDHEKREDGTPNPLDG